MWKLLILLYFCHQLWVLKDSVSIIAESGGLLEDWAAMDGNYNAENVYFDENILITTAVGNIGLTNGQGTIPAAGKNIKQVFEALWANNCTPENGSGGTPAGPLQRLS